MRILGIDYGKKKIGLAMAESEILVATPLTTIPTNSGSIDRIKEIVEADDIQKIVVGVTEGSTNSEQVELNQKFIQQLNDELSISIETHDEHFTSAEASRLMKEGELYGEDDDIAAMLMLQGYLEAQK